MNEKIYEKNTKVSEMLTMNCIQIDLKLGNLTEEEYKRMRKNYKVKMTYYEHMQRELAEKGIQLQKEEETQREEAQRESILTELDRPAVVSFISRIEVGPNKKIKIWFSFNEKT